MLALRTCRIKICRIKTFDFEITRKNEFLMSFVTHLSFSLGFFVVLSEGVHILHHTLGHGGEELRWCDLGSGRGERVVGKGVKRTGVRGIGIEVWR